jgi:hypothetical protein
MNRDQQRREMGGPLVRYEGRSNLLIYKYDLKDSTTPFLLLRFTINKDCAYLFPQLLFDTSHWLLFASEEKKDQRRTKGAISLLGWLAGSVVLESWCLLLLAGWLTGWLADWLAG